MKVKFLTVATIVALFIASCGGVDKKLVDDINKFEGEWTAMMKDLNTMSETMDKSHTEVVQKCDMVCNEECKDKKMQATMDSIKGQCNMAKDGMNSAMGNAASFKTDMDTATAKFTAWKAKVMSGEIKTEQANTDLTDFTKMMTEAKEQMKSIQVAFNDSKKMCMDSDMAGESCCEKK
jgi:predicted  nucleic acid-binding Zn-ribbon protein